MKQTISHDRAWLELTPAELRAIHAAVAASTTFATELGGTAPPELHDVERGLDRAIERLEVAEADEIDRRELAAEKDAAEDRAFERYQDERDRERAAAGRLSDAWSEDAR